MAAIGREKTVVLAMAKRQNSAHADGRRYFFQLHFDPVKVRLSLVALIKGDGDA